ncbi:Ligand-binding SRPBCC domain-containing protein [Gracilibacillus ureilyticus]|uniref:Ligand-binding SRPBCC domain-containing protein n=1 Tax=Gracilibacillus ureilyticus TaxID=531814 RepID=A0A1H9VQM0_9BACI|nr:SRPBCC family protein [Gracilibacillus ureilyticus]SES23821.1 Ligand-binding SRPBCC domain-containing protein [Gracilibacillus ureilyticus]
MPIIKHSQFIDAPVDNFFDLARNVDIHIKTTAGTRETAVAGVTQGLLEEGDTVTWEATHFGIKQRLTAKVTYMDKPKVFVDIMLKGAFHSFTHKHQFMEESGGTIMIDTFEYKSPFGLIGLIADKIFLEKYMRRFIISRAEGLKMIAEKLTS